jgi:membrane protein
VRIPQLRPDSGGARSAITSWFTAATVAAEPPDTMRGRALRAWFVISSAVAAFINDNDLLWAAALTYTTALAIVPIMALAFSVLKGFGLSDELQPILDSYGAFGDSEVSKHLVDYISHVNAAALGSLGGAFLLATTISTLGAIERAFNKIFRVPQSRSYLRKFTDYLSVLFTVPLFIVAALALTTVFSMKVYPIPAATHITPYLFAWTGFFFLFVFFPYTRVQWRAAAIGSLVTAILFQLAQFLYVHFQVGVGRYRAIYGALASVPIFLVWIYVAWIIVLFGAELTAAVQRGVPAFMLKNRSPEFPRAAALFTMLRLAENQFRGGTPVSYKSLAMELQVGLDAIGPIIDALKSAGFVVEDMQDRNARYRRIVLCRAPSAIGIDQILAAASDSDRPDIADPRIRKVLDLINEAARAAVKPITLADIMAPSGPAS